MDIPASIYEHSDGESGVDDGARYQGYRHGWRPGCRSRSPTVFFLIRIHLMGGMKLMITIIP